MWDQEWIRQGKLAVEEVFSHDLFLEGYPIFNKYLLKRKYLKILKVDAGTGRYGVRFSIDHPDSRIIVSDINKHSLQFVNKLAGSVKTGNVETVQKSILVCVKLTIQANEILPFESIYGVWIGK